MNPFNSKEYWNDRFSSGDWDRNGGAEQTAYFANIAISMLPEFVKRDLLENNWTIVDVGCAEGEATAMLAAQFPNCLLIGQDFSEEAVRRAEKKYPNCKFKVADVYENAAPAEVIFSSNTLEHLENPLLIISKLCKAAKKYVILLLPFQDGSNCQEHINLFTLKDFPLYLGKFYLEYSRLADCSLIEGDDWRWPQILLVYTNSEYRPEYMTLQEVHNQYNTTCLNTEELYRNLEVTRQDLNRLLLEKERASEQREQLIVQLQETSKQLAASAEQQMRVNQLLLHTQEQLAAVESQREQTAQQLVAAESQREQTAQQLATIESQREQTAEQLRRTEEQLATIESQREQTAQQLAAAESQREQIAQQLAAVESQQEQTAECLRETKEENTAIAEQLASAKSKSEELEKELKERNYYYDDLYAYSARRDRELEHIQNSRLYRFFLRLKKPLHIGYRIALKIKRMVLFLFTFRWGLLGKEIVSPFNKAILRIRGCLEHKKVMRALANDITGRNVIVFPPTLDWHMMLFQRPQQLASSYAKKTNTTVIYLTANLRHDHVALAELAKPHLWLVYSGCYEKITPLLEDAKKTIISLSWTINKPYIDMFHPTKLIYEYIDELEIFDKYDERMLQDHQMLMRVADVTVCTATKLFNQAKETAKNPVLLPNAGDYDFFAETKKYEINPQIKERLGNYRCVLGYYGALASWFDYDLVKMVAQRRPDWLFVLVGMDYDGTLGKSGVQEYDNILYIPPQPYQELPHFLKAFDIATIPFKINEITLSTSPVKLFEYMAAGKPILTSKMPECLKYESVKTYQDADEFCAQAERLLSLKPEDPYWETLEREALENTWDARTDEILKAIGIDPVGEETA